MKKIIFCLLFVLTAISCSAFLFACTDTDDQETCNHSYKLIEREATCEVGGFAIYECILCGNTYEIFEAPLGHNGNPCLTCGKVYGSDVWKASFYLNTSNQPTDKAYIFNEDFIEGTILKNLKLSKLYVRIFIDSENTAIKLYRNDESEIKTYSETRYDITLTDDDGNEHTAAGIMHKNGDRIYFDNFDFAALLKQNNKLKIFVYEKDYGYGHSYIFEVENAGFDTVYSTLFNK